MKRNPLAEIRKMEELDAKVWPFKVVAIMALLVSAVVLNTLDKATAKSVVVYWGIGMVIYVLIIALMDYRNSLEMKRWRKDHE